MTINGSSPYNLFVPNKNTNDQPYYGIDMRTIEQAHNALATNTSSEIAFLAALVSALDTDVQNLLLDTNITQVVSWMVGSAPPSGTRLTAYYGQTNCALNSTGEGFITIPGGGYSHGYVGFVILDGVYQPSDLNQVYLNMWKDNCDLANLWFTVTYVVSNNSFTVTTTPQSFVLQNTYFYGQQPGASPSPSVNVTFLTIGA